MLNAIITIGVFIANADGNLLITIYGQIASEFHDFSNGGWLLLMYPLAACATQTLVRALDSLCSGYSTERILHVVWEAQRHIWAQVLGVGGLRALSSGVGIMVRLLPPV